MTPRSRRFKARRTGIDTQQEAVVFMRSDCHVCRAEGLAARSQVALSAGSRTIIATLYHVSDGWLHHDEAGLSESAWERMSMPRKPSDTAPSRAQSDGQRCAVPDLWTPAQRTAVRGHHRRCCAWQVHRRSSRGLHHSLCDMAARPGGNGGAHACDGRSRRTPCLGMAPILDKHSIGGLPGNRTTPIGRRDRRITG